MSSPPAKMSVLVGERFACVKLAGRANFACSIDFKTLLTELLQKGYNYFVLDLSDCQLMDSTFLGVLSGFGLKLSAGTQGVLELLNANARITDLLENLGVLHLFRLTQGTMATGGPAKMVEPQPGCPTKEELARACLEAHQLLMELNPDNEARFKEVTRFLAEDLKRLKAAG